MANQGFFDQTISVEWHHELRYWAKQFGVSERELVEIMTEVGATTTAVADYINEQEYLGA